MTISQAKMTRRALLTGALGIGALTSVACTTKGQSTGTGSPAGDGARPIESFDMHADTIDSLGMVGHKPYSGFHNKFSGTMASNNGQLSADRVGDVRWAQCYAVWIPDTEGEDAPDISTIDWYHEAVAWFKDQMEQYSDQFTQARSFADIPAILDEGKVAAILTIENSACLDAGIEVIDEFANDGVLIAGLTWNYKNALGSGNQYPDQGLTDFGKECVAAYESHGIVVDVSHLNEKGFWELDKIATKPYIATHSNARAVCDHARNLTDKQFSAIAERGGVVGLNLHEGFVRPEGYAYTFDELAAHVDHWLELGGEDVIALGSDRDGADVPTWVADCSSQTYLFDRFADRLGEDIARKLFFENAMRFFGSVG